MINEPIFRLRCETPVQCVKITLPNINYAGSRKELSTALMKAKGKSDREDIILQTAEKQGYILRQDIEQHCMCPKLPPSCLFVERLPVASLSKKVPADR